MKVICHIVFLMCVLFVTPSSALAGLQITEVMYDPAKGGEWIEIYNPDDTAVDLKGWKLFDGASRSISTTATVLLNPGEYIILADDKNAFVSAFPDISLPVIDIVTAFNNTGDTIILRNPSGTDVSTMTYTESAGASKNNKTLQFISGEFLPWFPSIGADASVTKAEIEAATPATPTTPTTNQPTTTQTTQSQTSSPYRAWPSDMQLYVSAGEDKIALAGADVIFEGKVLSAARKPLPNADLIWTFGDGGSDRGTQVRHIFHYPGRYVVLLDVISGDYIAKDQIFVEVVPPQIEISKVEYTDKSYVELFNNTIHTLDIGGFILQAGGLTGTHFVIPKNTIILAGKKVIFPSEITRLLIKSDDVVLKFPSGDVIYSFTQKDKTEKQDQILQAENLTQSEPGVTQLPDTEIEKVKEVYSNNIISSLYQRLTNQPSIGTSPTSTATTTEEMSNTTEASETQPPIPQVAAIGTVDSNWLSSPHIPFILIVIFGVLALFLVLHYLDKKEREALGISKEADEIRIIE
jgi:hypothetical protein